MKKLRICISTYGILLYSVFSYQRWWRKNRFGSINSCNFMSLPSKHLLVFKRSWRRLQDVLKTSSTRLQRNNFTSSKTSWRRLEDVFKTSRKTSWKTKNCYAEDVFKTSWRHVLKTSWRHVLKTSWRHILKTSSRRLGGKQNFYWWYLYLTNLNVYLTNLCFTNYIWEN